MLIRAAEADEYAAIGALTLEAYRVDGHLDGVDDYGDELADAAGRAAEAALLVAVDESSGTLLGTVTYCGHGTPYAEVSRPGEAEFRMLAVAPQARGTGVGRALVEACVERARQEGRSAVALCSLPSMRPAHRLYEWMGFRRAPDRDWEPEPGIALIGYVLPLTPAP